MTYLKKIYIYLYAGVFVAFIISIFKLLKYNYRCKKYIVT
jgi:hypothetical protein